MSKSIFAEWIYEHAQYKAIYDTLVKEISRALDGGTPFIFPLLGDSRSGKTALLKDLEAYFSDRVSASGHTMVFYVAMPSAASNEALAVRIINGVIGDIAVKGRVHLILEQARKTMGTAGVVVLLVDEINHLVEKRTSEKAQSKENRQTADWFKEIVDLSGISIVSSGLTHVSRMYADNDQLQNRGLVGARIFPYAWSNKDDRIEYQNTIAAGIANFEKNGWHVDVSQDQLTRVSYLGGGGYIGKARDFLVRIEEIGDSKKRLDAKLLAQAYKDKYGLGSVGDPVKLESIDDMMLNGAHRDALQRAIRSGKGSET